MAATQRKNIWCPRTVKGIAPSERQVKMAASQGIYIADTLAYGSTSGTAKIAPTSAGSDAINLILTDAPTAEHAADDVVVAVVITTDLLLEMYVENAGTDSAAAQTIVNNDFEHVVSGTAGEIGYATLNIGANSDPTFIVSDIKSNLDDVKFTESTTPGVAIVKVIETVIGAQLA